MVNWHNYREEFPDRYVSSGYFDEYLIKLFKDKDPKTIVDIGGGETGTLALKNFDFDVYLLDPNVTPSEWMKGDVDWLTSMKFDAVVARGSINYLSKKEISTIPSLLKPNGFFVANTFLNHPSEEWNSRPYKTVTGKHGIELSRFNKRKKIIEHRLHPVGGQIIEHSFYYYSEGDYKGLLPGLKIIKYKNNSVILLYEK